MPLYDYECQGCGNSFERVVPMCDWKKDQLCECGFFAKRAFISGHGGMQDDTPRWIDDDLRRALQNVDNPGTVPITTRKQYLKYLKDNNIVPLC